MNIYPIDHVSSHRTGILTATTVEDISNVLGFQPNVDDDPDKVENSWAFQIGDDEFAIWDWKGSHYAGQFSTYGNHEVLAKLFPENYFGS